MQIGKARLGGGQECAERQEYIHTATATCRRAWGNATPHQVALCRHGLTSNQCEPRGTAADCILRLGAGGSISSGKRLALSVRASSTYSKVGQHVGLSVEARSYWCRTRAQQDLQHEVGWGAVKKGIRDNVGTNKTESTGFNEGSRCAKEMALHVGPSALIEFSFIAQAHILP